MKRGGKRGGKHGMAPGDPRIIGAGGKRKGKRGKARY